MELNISTYNESKIIIIGAMCIPTNTCNEEFTDIPNDIQNKITMETNYALC